jgi:hypothetical protein
MAYTTIDDPTIFFNTLIWTGNGASSRAISGLGFQPDWSWFKERSGAEDHLIVLEVQQKGFIQMLILQKLILVQTEDCFHLIVMVLLLV